MTFDPVAIPRCNLAMLHGKLTTARCQAASLVKFAFGLSHPSAYLRARLGQVNHNTLSHGHDYMAMPPIHPQAALGGATRRFQRFYSHEKAHSPCLRPSQQEKHENILTPRRRDAKKSMVCSAHPTRLIVQTAWAKSPSYRA